MSEREGDPMDRFASLAPDPEQQASNSEVRRLLEEAVEKLPDAYRTIFILRDIEEMSTTDAADVLEITEDNVKVRLHRARALLRKSLYARAGMERKEAFNFHAVRCDRVVKNVFERIQQQVLKTETPRRRHSDSRARCSDCRLRVTRRESALTESRGGAHGCSARFSRCARQPARRLVRTGEVWALRAERDRCKSGHGGESRVPP